MAKPEQSVRVGHYHSAVTRRGNKFIKMRLDQQRKEEKVRDTYNKVINITIYSIHSIYNLFS